MATVTSFNAYGFKSYGLDLTTTSATAIATVPADERFLIKSLILCNTHASASTDVSVEWYDSENTATIKLLVNHTLLAESTYEFFGANSGPVVLSGEDILKITASVANQVVATATLMSLGRVTGQL